MSPSLSYCSFDPLSLFHRLVAGAQQAGFTSMSSKPGGWGGMSHDNHVLSCDLCIAFTGNRRRQVQVR